VQQITKGGEEERIVSLPKKDTDKLREYTHRRLTKPMPLL